MIKNKVNPYTNFDPYQAALLFAAENDLGRLPGVVSFLSAYRGGDYDRGKKLGSSLARPEFGLEVYTKLRQLTALLTKVPFPGNKVGRRSKATKSFFDSEERCARINELISSDSFEGIPRRVLYMARDEVYTILGGDLSDSSYLECLRLARPGSGVSGGTQNRFRVSLPYKLWDTDLNGSHTAHAHFERMLYEMPTWVKYLKDLGREYVVQECNRIAFVPKDACTERLIAIEPSCNMFLQLGVHNFMAARLKAVGNCISDQTRNQRLAYFGSVTGNRSTIDLSAASDSVSTELVKFLFPPLWFAFLDDLRSKKYELNGVEGVYSKYASMGNGTTFAVETIIFLAIARACQRLTGGFSPSVYGDDIVSDRSYSLLLIETLALVGFDTNTDKTFITGFFRESCGKDYLHGSLVTPSYVRIFRHRVCDLYGLYNKLRLSRARTSRLRQYILESIRDVCVPTFTTPNEDFCSGIFTTLHVLKKNSQARWHRNYFNYKVPRVCFVSKTEHLPIGASYLASLFTGMRAEGALRELGVSRVKWVFDSHFIYSEHSS